MPRPPRFDIPGHPQHVVIRGNNRQALFVQRSDYSYFLNLLTKLARGHSCDIHCYVLMTNHTHLLITPCRKNGLPKLIQSLGRRYVQYFNKRYRRTGTLFEGRYKASLVARDEYLLCCYRYIELNPVRAQIVRHPADYMASSYRYNAFGEPDPLVAEHPTYLNLGDCSARRQHRYRQFVQRQDRETQVTSIREATQACHALGDDQFKDRMERILGRSVRPVKRGRPYPTGKIVAP